MDQGQTIVYGKLVRDQIPQIIEADGKTPTVRVLGESEVVPALTAKLAEEAEELRRAGPDDRLEELADIYEVLSALTETLGYSDEEVKEAAHHKRIKRGGFRRGLWLDEVRSAKRS
ncbi:nucleoside triphosphate pyrophosphohydrolase [Nonomuraea aridisoli]|uniref:Phosphoribosyl-ATP pyrophosphohydrolase n=1 Tax=Nonomuraea aridisoli TaxID=2070368 RepID=A0A2W2EFE8_9ACTN|nr:nucleoside triphosphate pyrophosphohydrolase [Nonomuraea aridisoli]PZG15589.1 phosphoribosyl-ATP pyrophosphohydrolase [Nonomuraea aridisoli]